MYHDWSHQVIVPIDTLNIKTNFKIDTCVRTLIEESENNQ